MVDDREQPDTARSAGRPVRGRRWLVAAGAAVAVGVLSVVVAPKAGAGDWFPVMLQTRDVAVVRKAPDPGAPIIRCLDRNQSLSIGHCGDGWARYAGSSAAMRRILDAHWCEILRGDVVVGFIEGRTLATTARLRAVTIRETSRYGDATNKPKRVGGRIAAGATLELREPECWSPDSFATSTWCFAWVDPDRTDRLPVGGWFRRDDLRLLPG